MNEKTLGHIRLDHIQFGHMNKAKEFWKPMQMTFLRRKDLSYIWNRRDHMSRTWYKVKRCRNFESEI